VDPITITVALLVLLAVVALPVFVIWRKGRPTAQGEVFRASRLTRGNRIFPTQVIVTPQSVVHFTPQWIGRHDHSIHIAHVASVSIDTGLMFSDVLIETTGGSDPIRCRGHRKGDAVRIKQLIEQFQSAYYRGAASTAPAPAPLPAR
jgi:predicted small integral membrane protein